MNPRLSVFLVAGLLPAAFSLGQTAPTPTVSTAGNDQTVKLEAFTVTGSNIKRLEAETVLPITIISTEELSTRAVATGAELFEQLPMFGSILINERATGPNDARGDAASVNLRGLGNNNTLILVNGRRVAPHPVADGDIPVTAVNVNSIPLAAMDQMQILRDGASAIYGSDAVAGVVNAVLKKNFDGTRLSFKYGQYEGGTPEWQGSLLFGRNFNANRSNILVFYSYFDRDELPASDRRNQRSSDKTSIVGGPQATARDASGNLIWNFANSQSQYGNFRAGTFSPTTRLFTLLSNAQSTQYPGIGSGGRFHVEPTATGARLAPEAQVQANFQDGQVGVSLYPGTKRHNVVAAANQKFNENISAFAEVLFYHAESVYTNDASPSGQSGNNGLFVARTNYYNPYGTRFYGPGTANPNLTPLDIRLDNYRLVDNGLRTIKVTSNSLRLMAGLRGTLPMLKNWEWEGAVLHNINKTIDKQDNRARESRLREALARNTPDAWNPFVGGGQQRPETVEFVNYSTRNDGRAEMSLGDLRASGELVEFWGGPISLAFGGEWRTESYQYFRDPLLKIPNGPTDPLDAFRPVGNTQSPLDDLIGISPSSDTDGSRDVYSLYAEVAVPIIGKRNELPIAKRLEASLAARYEHFSDFGDVTKPKFGLTWNPLTSVMLRGTYAEGFLAPSIAQLAQDDIFRTNTGRTDRYRFDVTGDTFVDGPSANTRELRAGNPNLQPEKSESVSFGIVAEIPKLRGLSISLDFWEVETKDRIGRNGIQNLIDEDFALRQAGNTTGSPSIIRRPFDPAEQSFWDAYNARNPNARRTPIGAIDYVRDDYFNIARRKLAGYDVGLEWRAPRSDFGQFNVKGDVSFLEKFEDQDAPGGAVTERVGENDKPDYKLNASVRWDRGPWSVDFFVNHIPSVDAADSAGDIVVNGQTLEWRLKSWTTYNASVGYRFDSGWIRNTRVRVGARNLFNEDAPLAPSAEGFDSDVHNARGRYTYLEITKSF
jgi:iron complex outermembrane recepter protein